MTRPNPRNKRKRLFTTRDLMGPTGMQTTQGVVEFLKREGMATKIGGRYKVRWNRIAAHWPEFLEDLESNETNATNVSNGIVRARGI